jgi:hypothetical protein
MVIFRVGKIMKMFPCDKANISFMLHHETVICNILSMIPSNASIQNDCVGSFREILITTQKVL